MDLFTARKLAFLPHRQSFYKQGGWRDSPLPGSSQFDYFLNQHFSRLDLQQAQSAAANIPNRVLPVRSNQQRMVRSGYISLWDPEYPFLLRSIFDPPPVLFYALYGKYFPESDACYHAMVGTRKPHAICNEAIALRISELKQEQEQCWLVSGFAMGVDRLAHLHAIDQNVATIAVLGSGLAHAGPKVNLDLIDRVYKQKGSLLFLSEFPAEMSASRWTFPRRNRIIAGLSAVTSVIQAPWKSGSMITARYALEEGREIEAFDHSLLQKCEGLNDGARSLLMDGARSIQLDNDSEYDLIEESWRPSMQMELNWRKKL